MNGDVRGGSYDQLEGKAIMGRSGLRGIWWPRTLVYRVIGFRSEWCYQRRWIYEWARWVC